MSHLPHSPEELKRLYEARFQGKALYRRRVWDELCRYFSQWIPRGATVLDLGCGHCEFINAVGCGRKYGMDLNPDSRSAAADGVEILLNDCSAPWPIPAGSIDVVFSSNFFEHLPTKRALEDTLRQAWAALAEGGKMILLGPNIKYVPGRYWDFFDHYLPLTELSLSEVLTASGFTIDLCRDRFLPYTMSQGRERPVWMLRAYLRLPLAWRFFGEQFLIVASKR
ncbi:MAG TPA: class I SAM-dependent methyltransferase [Bryobacteraceae bacterium]|nr:class I SAM-dependent methyltransferase [Bryobacteraceae bacterium]